MSQQLSDSLTTEAIQNGRHKAEVIAAALGRTLGPVKRFLLVQQKTSSMDSGYYRNAVMLKAALKTATPVEKGSLVVSQDANITLLFYNRILWYNALVDRYNAACQFMIGGIFYIQEISRFLKFHFGEDNDARILEAMHGMSYPYLVLPIIGSI